MSLLEGLIGAILALGGWLLYERSKRRSAEALNDNLETKEKVLKDQAEIEKNKALLEAEKENLDNKLKEIEKEKNKDVSNDDVLDFFKKRDS